MKVTRNSLIATANLIAFKAILPDADREKIVEAMQHTPAVAIGRFGGPGRPPEECCPLTQAGIFPLGEDPIDFSLKYRHAIDRFWMLFDDAYKGQQRLEVIG